jgi:hypothetical protein
MVLGDVDRTRRLSGNPLTTNVSNDDITTYLGYGTSMVKSETGKDFEAEPTHSDYNSAVMAAEYFAASAIRDRFGDKDDVSLEFYNRAKEIIAQVSKNLEGGATSGTTTVKASYKSYPLNGELTPYQSMHPTSEYLGEDVIGPRA